MARTLATVFLLASASALHAEAPEIVSLQTQRRGETTYFTVQLRAPRDLGRTALEANDRSVRNEGQRRRLARLPRLVPQDDRTSDVYFRFGLFPAQRDDLLLAFTGKVHGQGTAKLLLLYPRTTQAVANRKASLRTLLLSSAWTETPLTLDFRRAKALKPFAGVRDADTPPASEDLKRRWAEAQADQLAILETQTRDFSFYGLARTLTGRKYQVLTPSFVAENTSLQDRATRQLYEMTTGAAALTESLALARLRGVSANNGGERSISINEVPGINVAEHPWKKMIGEQRPDPEPLAALTPHDFYYVSFRGIGSLLDLGDLIDQWGGNLWKGYEITSRDFQVRERYEKQLCLKRTGLARTLGPTLLHGVALVGSDVYVREGSDVTVLFHVRDRALFLAAVEPFVQAARKEFGDRLQERKTHYHGVAVESFVTPRHEVSLHRAAVGDFVIYSSSPVALRRVLDTRAERRTSLAQSLDFQYMRTIFRKSNKDEDGFAFLSDAFIRQLVGPASKIKEKRRLEALTSLRMMTDAALFVAWETGRIPKDRESLLKASGIKVEEIAVPEGRDLVWDGAREEAASDTYNTLAFATPLIELPIDKITPREAAEYRQFRQEYLNLWRRYFDPIGMRLSLRDKRVQVETYILPLIDSSGFRDLRRATGQGTTKLDLASLSPKTLMQMTAHLVTGSPSWGTGDQVFVRVDDSPKYAELIELWMRQDYDPVDREKWERQVFRAVWELPITLGVRIGDKKVFARSLEAAAEWFKVQGKAIPPPYKGVSIRPFSLENLYQQWNASRTHRFDPVLYHATVDDFWYLSTSLESLRDTIDRAVARRDQRDTGEQVELNSSLYLAPEAMFSAAKAFQGYLEWESHQRAVSNNPIWYVLKRGNVVKDFDSPQVRQAALRYFAFVPVSPDGSPYRYDGVRQEVSNDGYGSLRRPKLRSMLPASSPLAQLLEQVRILRVDLRFREDGIHTILTMDRLAPKK
ncbi:MAG TPA: hypothetical protein VMG10_30225 [Gemmataceae bacterium]|nr:hypothetical protein [Gemmataceae bacterium]